MSTGPSATSSGTDAARSSVNFVVRALSHQRRASSIQISAESRSKPLRSSILKVDTVQVSSISGRRPEIARCQR